MKLQVRIKDVQFVNYLIEQMKEWFWRNLDTDKLIPFQKFVDYTGFFSSIFIKKLQVKDVCFSVVDTLHYKRYTNRFEIEFDPDVVLYGINFKVKDFVNLINYGNLDVSAYPIFSDMFNYFLTNMDKYYKLYLDSERW